MLKEIFEQPEVMRDVMRGRVRIEEGRIVLGGIEDYLDRLKQAKRIVICACGTSWHAGLIGEYLIEDFAAFRLRLIMPRSSGTGTLSLVLTMW